MALFSERYGYTKASDVIIREQITPEIQNAICSCYDKLSDFFYEEIDYYNDTNEEYRKLEKYLWVYFLNERAANFSDGRTYHVVATVFIEDKSNAWYKKLDIIEKTIEYLRHFDATNHNIHKVASNFIKLLNSAFERLNFAYRIINDEIVEITSEQEIKTIETAIDNSARNVKMHLNRALELYAQRPDGDYRNSIKESISAVEAFCREKTGENTLGKALNKLEKNGIVFPDVLKHAFDKLYAYTNQPDAGIRHALMDDTGVYTPKAEEAIFMLVSCSAFINYLNKKV
ncbi:MAG: hypothetical protein IJX60_01760 [Paludibacteraceae bacterium]|nr:hypothetical protein [Paludibacteraceae bacterium]